MRKTDQPVTRHDRAMENARMALVRSVGCAMGKKDVQAVIDSLRRDGWTISPPWNGGE